MKVAERARLVEATIAFVENTSLAPDCYERQLLKRFIEGELTIYQVLELLEAREAAAEASA